MKKFLVLDNSNIMYKTFYAMNKGSDVDTNSGIAIQAALFSCNKYFKKYNPTQVVMTFDRPNWRKKYTESEECISQKIYKGNRRQKSTPAEKRKYKTFKEQLFDFETLMRERTSVICLSGEDLEADDLIAMFVYMHPDDEIIIISSDKDLIQLLDQDNVRLIDPATGKARTLDDWNGDRNLFMFEKCIRGDFGDNVQSALPRVRKTRILKAYNDEFEKTNLMNETWIHPVDDREMSVKALFEEGKLLMDLTNQPLEIQKKAVRIILHEMKNIGNFSYFHFMRYLGKRGLKKIADQATTLAKMLNL